MKKRYFISAVIITQLVIISIFGIHIYKKRSHVLGQVSIVPIQKDHMVQVKSNELKFFYEPQANTTQTDDSIIPIAASNTINADSLNERFEYSVAKQSDVFRVITLGDSFTFGHYVNTKDNWTERMEDLLNNACRGASYTKYEVINLGVYGYDAQYSVERFIQRGLKYEPDLVLWLLKDDDLLYTNELFQGKAMEYDIEMKKTGEYDREVAKGNYAPAWQKAMKEMNDKYKREGLINMNIGYMLEFNNIYSKRLGIVVLPSASEDITDSLERFASSRPGNFYYELATNIYRSEDLYYKNDWHPTVEGHKVIANDIYKYLTQNNIIPCN